MQIFHIPVRLPPDADAFRGFIYADEGNLGIEDAEPPFYLVGFVIELMVGPLQVQE
jgi:hypothetical protein